MCVALILRRAMTCVSMEVSALSNVLSLNVFHEFTEKSWIGALMNVLVSSTHSSSLLRSRAPAFTRPGRKGDRRIGAAWSEVAGCRVVHGRGRPSSTTGTCAQSLRRLPPQRGEGAANAAVKNQVHTFWRYTVDCC